jgi:hypothetical protein
MTDQKTTPAPVLDSDHVHTVVVLVNEKKVRLVGEVQTGKTIKVAAIAQGVPIQLDFVLSIERGGGRTELVPDDKTIKVKEHDRFLAIPNDDNS